MFETTTQGRVINPIVPIKSAMTIPSKKELRPEPLAHLKSWLVDEKNPGNLYVAFL